MKYLTRRDGTLWFQIRVPNALVRRYGTVIRQCLRTADLSIAQPIALQLAGHWLARFSAEKFDTATGFEGTYPSAPEAPPPDPTTHQAIPDPNPVTPQASWSGYGYPSQHLSHQAPPVYGHPQQPLPPQAQFEPPQYQQPSFNTPQPSAQRPVRPARSKTAYKTTPDAIETMDDALIYWRRMRPDLSKSSLPRQADQLRPGTGNRVEEGRFHQHIAAVGLRCRLSASERGPWPAHSQGEGPGHHASSFHDTRAQAHLHVAGCTHRRSAYAPAAA